MKKIIRILIPVLIIAIGFTAGILIYRKTGIKDMVEKNRAAENEKDVIATIGKRTFTTKEAKVYLTSVKNQTELIYGDEVWNYRISAADKSYKEMMKDNMLEKIKYIKVVCEHASEYDVTLSQEDMADVSAYVSDFFAGITESTAREYELTNELLTKIYSENILANKVYSKITLNHDTSANETNCRQADYLYMCFNKYVTDEDNNPVYLEGDALKALKEKAEAAYNAAKHGNFQSVAAAYCPEEKTELTCGKEDLPAEFADTVMNMKEGDTSALLESRDAYYIFKCVKYNNEEATKMAVQKKINSEREDYFRDIYEDWYSKTDISIDTEKWDSVVY